MEGGANYYNAHVWQAVMAQTLEIILWCAGQLYPPNPSSDEYPDFVKLLPEFDKAAGILKPLFLWPITDGAAIRYNVHWR